MVPQHNSDMHLMFPIRNFHALLISPNVSFFTFLSLSLLQLCAYEWKRLGTMWLCVEEELLRERGVFGPGPGVVLTRGWVQDAAEGPNRTRPRIRRRAQRRSKRVLAITVYHSCLTQLYLSLFPLCQPLSLRVYSFLSLSVSLHEVLHRYVINEHSYND